MAIGAAAEDEIDLFMYLMATVYFPFNFGYEYSDDLLPCENHPGRSEPRSLSLVFAALAPISVARSPNTLRLGYLGELSPTC